MAVYIVNGEIIERGEDDVPTPEEVDVMVAQEDAAERALLTRSWGPYELAEAKMEHDTGHCDADYWPAWPEGLEERLIRGVLEGALRDEVDGRERQGLPVPAMPGEVQERAAASAAPGLRQLQTESEGEAVTTIRIAGTNDAALTDGPGLRFSIYVQGCSVRCKGCQVPHLWNRNGGREVDVKELAREALASGLPISILGGEPTDQPQALYELLFWLREGRLDKGMDDPQYIIVYTGRTFEELLERVAKELQNKDTSTSMALLMIDVLVDGPFIEDQDDDYLQYRGSRNQRVIALPETWEQRRDGNMEPVLCDWDTPEIVLTPEGDLLGAEGLMIDLVGGGEPARRCGEVA
jgi:anaerobic ribonucleoside-triphosphate reductase activating protein